MARCRRSRSADASTAASSSRLEGPAVHFLLDGSRAAGLRAPAMCVGGHTAWAWAGVGSPAACLPAPPGRGRGGPGPATARPAVVDRTVREPCDQPTSGRRWLGGAAKHAYHAVDFGLHGAPVDGLHRGRSRSRRGAACNCKQSKRKDAGRHVMSRCRGTRNEALALLRGSGSGSGSRSGSSTYQGHRRRPAAGAGR